MQKSVDNGSVHYMKKGYAEEYLRGLLNKSVDNHDGNQDTSEDGRCAMKKPLDKQGEDDGVASDSDATQEVNVFNVDRLLTTEGRAAYMERLMVKVGLLEK